MTRAANIDVEHARNAQTTVGPFLSEFDQWHRRSALISARLLARDSSAAERKELVTELKALLEHIEECRTTFQQATAAEPAHARINDVAKAFDQLLSTLRTLRSS